MRARFSTERDTTLFTNLTPAGRVREARLRRMATLREQAVQRAVHAIETNSPEADALYERAMLLLGAEAYATAQAEAGRLRRV